MEAEDDMEDEMMNKRDLDATTLEGICVVDVDFSRVRGRIAGRLLEDFV